MKALKNYGTLITIIVLLVIIFLMRECGKGGGPVDSIHDPAIQSIDTVFKSDTVKTFRVDTFWKTKYVAIAPRELPTPVVNPLDTNMLVYNDSFQTEDLKLFTQYAVYGKMAGSPIYRYELNLPTVLAQTTNEITNERTITIKKYTYGLFAGGGIGYAPATRKFMFSLGATYVSKRGGLYGYSYDILGKSHNITYQYRLLLLKKNR